NEFAEPAPTLASGVPQEIASSMAHISSGIRTLDAQSMQRSTEPPAFARDARPARGSVPALPQIPPVIANAGLAELLRTSDAPLDALMGSPDIDALVARAKQLAASVSDVEALLEPAAPHAPT